MIFRLFGANFQTPPKQVDFFSEASLLEKSGKFGLQRSALESCSVCTVGHPQTSNIRGSFICRSPIVIGPMLALEGAISKFFLKTVVWASLPRITRLMRGPSGC